MLLGLYIIMPVISPWLDKLSRKEELMYLGIWLYNKVILPISSASYGMYLMHMLMLPHWFGIYNPLLPEWLTIPATAISTYICCFGISWAIGKLPMGKYIVG